MKNRKTIVLAIAAVITIFASLWYKTTTSTKNSGQQISGTSQQPSSSPVEGGKHTVSNAPVVARTIVETAPGSTTTNSAATMNQQPDLTVEQQLAQRMENLLDENDESGALKIARQLLQAKDAEVRSDVVDTLGWIGVKALPELTVMLDDEDPDIADEAQRRWLEALDDVESPQARAELLCEALTLLRDEDDFTELAIEAVNLPDVLAARMYAAVIERTATDNPTINVLAKEEFESLTGEIYTTPERVEQWIVENPEYE